MRRDYIDKAATSALTASDLKAKVRSLAVWICSKRLQAPVLLFIEMHRPFRNVFHALAVIGEPSLRLFFAPSQLDIWRQILESPELLDELVQHLSGPHVEQEVSSPGLQREASHGS